MKTILSVFIVFLFTSITAFAAEIPVRSMRTLRQQFDSYTEMLQKEVLFSKEKEKKQKFALLNQAISQMKIIRSEIDSADHPDAIQMDTLIAALDQLPSQRGFKKKNCAEYESRLPQDPAAKPAMDFLQTLCN